MRDKIQKIVVEAVAGTKDITKAIDELLLLHNVMPRYYVAIAYARIIDDKYIENTIKVSTARASSANEAEQKAIKFFDEEFECMPEIIRSHTHVIRID